MTGWDDNRMSPYIQNWNLELQRELAAERSGRREETKPELVASAETDKPKASRAKAARPADAKPAEGKPEAGTIEPIIPS